MAGKQQNQQPQGQKTDKGSVKPEEDTETGTPDSTYALISTVYHLLQGAETMSMFVEDAHEDGLEEVAEFLEETRDEFISRAERAKELLAECLSEEGGGDSDDED